MAVDTAAKRFSMVGFGAPVQRSLLVPSGTVGAQPRADLLWLYSGIALDAPPAVVGKWWLNYAEEIIVR